LRGERHGCLRAALGQDRDRRLGAGTRLAAARHGERRAERDLHGTATHRARGASRRPCPVRPDGPACLRRAPARSEARARLERPAVFAGEILAERVAGPKRALTAAATRLAAGDFSASIPPGGAAEVGALARTMETMRRNLIDLTTTLRRREAEAQAVLGGIVEGVYAVDRNRMIRYLNPQAARLLGVTTEQAVGRFCGDVLQPRNEDGRRPC